MAIQTVEAMYACRKWGVAYFNINSKTTFRIGLDLYVTSNCTICNGVLQCSTELYALGLHKPVSVHGKTDRLTIQFLRALLLGATLRRSLYATTTLGCCVGESFLKMQLVLVVE